MILRPFWCSSFTEQNQHKKLNFEPNTTLVINNGMETSEKSGWESLPRELLIQITSYLDNSALKAIRASNRSLWKLLLVLNFAIPATELILAGSCSRILEYYHTTLVGLEIVSKTNEAIDSVKLLENIAKLTNLSSLKSAIKFGSAMDYEIWFKLSTLTNLYYCDWTRTAPESVSWQYWTKLTRLQHTPNSYESTKEILQKLINLREVYLQDITYSKYREVFEDCMIHTSVTKLHFGNFSSLPAYGFKNIHYFSHLKDLRIETVDDSIQYFPFSQLISLQDLMVRSRRRPKPGVDLGNNTKLTSLVATSEHTSFSNLVKLRVCTIELQTTDNTFCRTLTNLERLLIDVNESSVNPEYFSSLNLPKLTFLSLLVKERVNYGDLSLLTSLVDLTIWELQQFESCGKVNMSTLNQLKYLHLQINNMADFEGISRLANLTYLRLLTPVAAETVDFPYSLSLLTNLEELSVTYVDVLSMDKDLQIMKKLSDLTCNLYDDSDFSFLEIIPLKSLTNRNEIYSPFFWWSVTSCTTLESLIHRCLASEVEVDGLTALTNLTQLVLSYSGNLNMAHLTLLTSLRSLNLFAQNGWPNNFVSTAQLRTAMTWLECLITNE